MSNDFDLRRGVPGRQRALLLQAAATCALLAFATPAVGQPSGAVVIAGQASVASPSATSTIINQSTSKAVINWQNFSVGAGASVQFNQPDSASLTLNRVVGGGLSAIDGAVKANGQVWLINPNGVLFGQGAQINVGGLLATTSDIANADFLSGNYAFSGAPAGSSVTNKGSLRAATSGSIVLSAPQVSNSGLIVANAGHVVLGGADAFTVDFSGDRLLSYAVTASAKSDVRNTGMAVGGKVLLTTRAVRDVEHGVVNDKGVVEATHAHIENGEVVLGADDGAVVNSGTVDVSGKGPGQTGGTVEIQGKSVMVADGARIDASGDAGGGTVLIGGNFHGAGPQLNAQSTSVGKATIKADAITSGNGGKVAVWSDGQTRVAAAISAQGGADGGDGGQVETSGATLQIDDATTVNTAAIGGTTGDWLLDPSIINIATGGAGTLDGSNNYPLATSPGLTITIAPSTITSALGSSNVTLEASSLINVDNSVSFSSIYNLTLLSQGNITISNSAVQNSGAGNIVLVAGWDGTSHPTGLAAASTYGLSSGTITLQGQNASVGSASGKVYLSAYGLSLQDNGSPHYAQVGYHGAGGGDINIQTLAGGVTLNESYGGVTQIGNGGYDGAITGAATGNISITTTGTTSVQTYQISPAAAKIGNYAGANGASGNISLVTGTLTSGGAPIVYDANTFITDNIGTSAGTGGDVSLTLTAAATTALGFTYNSPHNVSVTSNNALTVGATSYNGGGSLTLASATNITVSGAMTTSGTNALSLLAQGSISVSASIQDSTVIGAGGIVLVAGWDGASHPAGLAGVGTYGLTGSGTITISGTAAVGSYSGGTYLSAYGLTLQGGSGANNYAQVGYHASGGGDIYVQTLAGGVALSQLNATSTSQIGNGAYDVATGGADGGNIAITTTGNTDISVTGNARIGNYAGINNRFGTIALTTGTMTPTSGSYSVSNFIDDAVGILDFVGSDVTLNLTAVTSTVDIALSYNSPHNISISASNDLRIGATSYEGAGNLTLATPDSIDVNGAMTSSSTNRLSLLAGGYITAAASIQNSGAGDIVIVQGWDGASHPTGLAAAGTYGLTTNNISLNGANVAIGSAAGNTYLSGWGLQMGDTGSTSYAQVGYHGAGGGNIAIETSGGNINLNESYGGSGAVQLGNGGYDGTIGSIATGNITITAVGGPIPSTGIITITNAGGHAAIGNYAGANGESGNVTLTTGNLASSGTVYNANTLITANIGTSAGTGGDVSLTLTAAGAATAIAALSYNSPHNVTLATNNTFTFSGAIFNSNNGNLTLNTGLALNDANNIHTNGDLTAATAAGNLTLSGTLLIGGTTTVTSGTGAVALANTNNVLTSTVTATSHGGTYGGADAITIRNSQGLTLGAVTALSNGGATDYGGINIQTGAGDIVITDNLYGGTIYLAAYGAIAETGSGNVWSHHTGDNTTGGSLVAIANHGNISLPALNNRIEQAADSSGLIAAGLLQLTSTSSLANTVSLNGGSITLNGADVGSGSLALTLTGSYLVGGAAPVTVYDSLEIAGTIQAADGLALTADGDITQRVASSAAITTTSTGSISSGLRVASNFGKIELKDSGNAVAGGVQLTSNNSSATLNNSISTLLGSSSADGVLTVVSGGDLTIDSGAVLSSNASGDGAIVLAALGHFINNAGTGALTLPSGGFQIYSHDPSGDNFNGLDSGNSAVWNTTYASGITGSDPGHRYIFAIQPTVTVTTTDITKTNAGDDVTAAVAAAYTLSGLQGVSGAFQDTAAGTPSVTSTGAAPNSDAAPKTYAITASSGSLVLPTGYGVSFVNTGVLTLAVLPTLTYVATAAVKIYGDANPIFTGTVTGFQPGDTQASSTSGTIVWSSSATQFSNVSSYEILGSGLSSSTYQLAQASSNYTALTINPATLDYVANTASKTYGDPNPVFSGMVTGFVGTDTQSNATTGTLAFDSAATSSFGVGSYAINGSGLSANNGNYTFQQAAGNNAALTIDAATLTYVANAASKTYGDINPAFAGFVVGFVGTDTQGSATTGTLTFTSSATAGSGVGNYAVDGSGLAASNYVFVQKAANGAALTINPATLTYVASTATRIYGDANPAFGGTVTGFVGTDTQSSATTGTLVFASSATGTSVVGSYAVNGSGLSAANYSFVQAAGNNTALTIDRATLTYVANAAARIYGGANPVFGGAVTGFAGTDTQSSATTGTLVFASGATTTSSVGSYAINGSGLSAANYSFAQASGNSVALTINPATLTYVAGLKSKIYGDANPVFAGSVTGFVGTDTQSNATTGTLVFTSPATAASGVGNYAINGSGLSAGNYNFVQSGGNATALIINPASLAYTADFTSRTYGAANPAFSGTVMGFVNGDTQSSATTGTLAFSSSATSASNVGSYAVNGSGLTANSNYVLSQAGANATALIVTPATLTYVAGSASRSYGDVNPVLAGSVTGFVGTDTQASATTGTLVFATSATTTSGVGSYTVNGSGLSAGNYSFVQASGNSVALTINPAVLTYVADTASRTYGAPNPFLTGSVTGFVNSDTQASATTGTLAFASAATSASGVGNYAVSGFGLSAGNYVFVQAAGNSAALAVNPATLTYVASAATRTYGDANPAFSGTVTGFVNADTQSSATTGTLAFASSATAASGVGSYEVNGSGLAASNYVFVQKASNSAALTINPAILTYGASAATKIYGDANPAFTGTVTGFVNGDTQSSATTGTLVFASSATGASVVGSYTVNGSGLGASNYSFVQAAGNSAALTINPATLTYVASTATKIYGDANPAFSGTVAGFVNNDTQSSATTGTLTFTSSATAGSGVGTYAVDGSGLAASNYVFVQKAANSVALTINPATLTYVASTATRIYGDANPAFGGTVTGFVNGDTQSSATTGALGFTVQATAASSVGSYAITGSGLSAANYSFVQAAGNSIALTINPAILTYAADAASRVYGAADPSFGGTVTGFVNGDTLSSATTGTLHFATIAVLSSNVGSYAINANGLSAKNYSFVQAAGNSTALTITQATLTYVASAASRSYGAANPGFGGTVTGFVNNDTLASATTGALVFTAQANAASGVGRYAINGVGLSANNYNFVQAAANASALAINPAILTAVLTGTVSKSYDGTTTATLSAANYASLAGIVANDNVSLASFPATGVFDSAEVGSGKTVTVSGLSLAGSAAANYVLASTSASGPIGVISPAISIESPALISFTVNPPILVILQTLTNPASIIAPSSPIVPVTPTQAVRVATLTTPNPIESLAAPDSGGGPTAEPQTPADTATSYVVDSMEGTAPVSATPVNVIIPGILHAEAGPKPPPPGTGDNLSAWGNSSLWQ